MSSARICQELVGKKQKSSPGSKKMPPSNLFEPPGDRCPEHSIDESRRAPSHARTENPEAYGLPARHNWKEAQLVLLGTGNVAQSISSRLRR